MGFYANMFNGIFLTCLAAWLLWLECGPQWFLAESAGAVEGDPSRATLPDLGITLYGESGDPLCIFKLDDYAKTTSPLDPDPGSSNDALTYSTRNDETGWFSRSFIFQNFQPCIPSLAPTTRIGFSSLSNSGVSFCLQDLSLLPSQVASAGERCLHNKKHCVPIWQLPAAWHIQDCMSCTIINI